MKKDEIIEQQLWTKPDSEISNLIIDFISGNKNVLRNIIQEIEQIEDMFLFLHLSKPFKNMLYYGDEESEFLEGLFNYHKSQLTQGKRTRDTVSKLSEYNNMRKYQESDREEYLEFILKKIIKYDNHLNHDERKFLYRIIQKDTILSFLCKILPDEIVINILERLSDKQLPNDLIISVIFNHEFSNEIIDYLLRRRGFKLKQEYLDIAIQVGNINAVRLFCTHPQIVITSEILYNLVSYNNPDILEYLIDVSRDYYRQIISTRIIGNAFRQKSLVLLRILLKHYDLINLGLEREVFHQLILNNWCSSRWISDWDSDWNFIVNYTPQNQELLLFLIKEKSMEINFTINLERFSLLRPRIKSILLYYSNITNKSEMIPQYRLEYSDTEFQTIIEAREREMMRYINEVLWSGRKDFAVFRGSVINSFLTGNRENPKPPSQAEIALNFRHLGPHIASFLGDIDINRLYTFILPNGKTILRTIDYVL